MPLPYLTFPPYGPTLDELERGTVESFRVERDGRAVIVSLFVDLTNNRANRFMVAVNGDAVAFSSLTDARAHYREQFTSTEWTIRSNFWRAVAQR